MKTIKNTFKLFMPLMLLLCGAMRGNAQTAPSFLKAQLTDFFRLAAQSDLNFTYPAGFRQIPAINNEDFSFDLALELPGKGFEAWFRIKSQKQNWTSYEHARYDQKMALANPDSAYIDMANANARELTDDNSFFIKNIPPDVLARYGADAGKSILINLLDLAGTNHYKYALIIALQKYHTATLLAVYFTNDKDPEFYKDVYRAGRGFRFKPQKNN